MVASARRIGPDVAFSHSVSVSVRSIVSCIALSSLLDVGSGKLFLRAMAFEMLGVWVSSRGTGTSLGLQFRFGLGSEVGVDFPDTRPAPGAPKLAVFSNARPRGSGL